eukprot:CAMPEP_0194148164 /NCGR_PEP_ID=MMETSP0152-20130528/30501_1 /TAXON_ID=1049557 /ORGANISM="Thalassiothrix antarctica, Strain L6-D1" /LENGTH=410 /DNA_ID=CAMNT_0038849503 /DNA_START=36 /DNA_END=1269 /DNA_ORIENTATION=+
MSDSNDKYGKLWNLLDIRDEAVVHEMEIALRRVGVYNLDDLAFLSVKDMGFPSMVNKIFRRKFSAVCEYYALGNRLKRDSTIQDVLQTLNANAAQSPLSTPNGNSAQQPENPHNEVPVAQAIPISEPLGQNIEKPSSKHQIHVVIIGDCSPYKRGWHHLEQFLKIETCYVHSVINIGHTDETLVIYCRDKNIQLIAKIEELLVPQPNLYVLGPSRNHDLFKLMNMKYPPSSVLLDLPGTITLKSLEALSNVAADNNCPLYLNCSRVVAPYVQNTLEVASLQTRPQVSWFHNQSIPMVRMSEAFSKGRILHTSALPELMIAVMYFGVKVESICRFQVNPAMTNYQTISGITDYVRAAFMMTTHSGVQLSIIVDRNANATSCLGVVNDDQGRVIQQFDHMHAHCDLKLKEDW